MVSGCNNYSFTFTLKVFLPKTSAILVGETVFVTSADGIAQRLGKENENIPLSEINELLRQKGALKSIGDKPKFCNEVGSWVNDTTSFGSYLQFTGQDKPDTTAFIIYLLQKEKKEGEMETNPEYRKALREATQSASSKKVHLDLPTKLPLLERPNAKPLESSIDRSSMLGKQTAQTENTRTVGKLSEADWLTLIGTNSLLNGRVMEFQDHHRGAKGSCLQGIKKAVGNAFYLKGRALKQWELPHAELIGKGEQKSTYLIPNYTIPDDPWKIEVFETKTSEAEALAKSNFSQQAIQGTIGLPIKSVAFGISGGHSKREADSSVKDTSEDSKVIHIRYNCPCVVVYLDHTSVALTPECTNDLNAILKDKNPDDLVQFCQKYGHVFCPEVQLGGRLYSSEKSSARGKNNTNESEEATRLAAEASLTSAVSSAGLSVSGRRESQSRESKTTSDKSLDGCISWEAEGGNPSYGSSPGNWVHTIEGFETWRVIKYEKIIPIGDFIGKLPGHEQVPKIFQEITECTRKTKMVDIRFELVGQGKTQPDDRLFVALEEKGAGESLGYDLQSKFIKYYADVPQSRRVEGDMAKYGEMLADCLGGLQGKLRPAPDGKSCEFQAEVETILGQPAQIRFQQPFTLFNKTMQTWLRTEIFEAWDFRYTIIGSDKDREKATSFVVENVQTPTKSGVVNDQDICMLRVYARDRRKMGLLSRPSEQDGAGTSKDFQLTAMNLARDSKSLVLYLKVWIGPRGWDG